MYFGTSDDQVSFECMAHIPAYNAHFSINPSISFRLEIRGYSSFFQLYSLRSDTFIYFLPIKLHAKLDLGILGNPEVHSMELLVLLLLTNLVAMLTFLHRIRELPLSIFGTETGYYDSFCGYTSHRKTPGKQVVSGYGRFLTNLSFTCN
jgi:hypothetical protein